MSWTDERIEQLTKMWESGLTASQIADELGGVSRNAVIGKAHRLGLKSRPSPVKANDSSAKTASTKPRAKFAAAAGKDKPEGAADASASAKKSAAKAAAASKSRAAPTAAEASKPASSGAAAPAGTPGGDAAKLPPGSMPNPQAVGRAEAQRVVSVGPGGFLRQGPGDQQPPIPPAPPRRLVPARPSPEIAGKTTLLDLNERICRWPLGHPGEPDFHFCGEAVNPGFPYCVEHCGRAFQAQLPRGARRPPPPMPFGGPRVR